MSNVAPVPFFAPVRALKLAERGTYGQLTYGSGTYGRGTPAASLYAPPRDGALVAAARPLVLVVATQ